MGWLEKGTEAPFLQGLNQHLPSLPWEHCSLFNGQTSSTSRELHTLRGTEAPAPAWITAGPGRKAGGGRVVTCSLPCTHPLSHTQLDKLRTIIENMLASSSTLLSMSLNMAPHKPLTTLAPSQIDPAATCPACSLDLSHQVSMLVQRYEQLQNMVSNLAASRPSKKAKLQSQVTRLPPSWVAANDRPPGAAWGVSGGGMLGHFCMMEPFSSRPKVPGLSVGSQQGQPLSWPWGWDWGADLSPRWDGDSVAGGGVEQSHARASGTLT